MRHSLPILVFSLWCLPSVALGNTSDKADLMASDDSVAQYERKAIINFAQVWIEDARVSLPVTHCTVKKKKVEKEDGESDTKESKNCKSRGSWYAEMRESWVQRNTERHANVLVTPRFDQILVGPSSLKLITPLQETSAELDLFTYRPNYEVGSYSQFKSELLKSLNLLAPALKESQMALNSARYQSLPDKEKGTFMAEQAKGAGIPLSVYERLSASTYAFGVYVPKVEGSIELTKTVDTDGSVSHSASIDVPLKTRLVVYRFNGDDFSVDLELTYGDSFASGLGRALAGSASMDLAFAPTKDIAQELFETAFNRSFRDSYITLSNDLKKDRRFALQAPIASGPEGFTVPLGIKDGIRARHPFRIFRTVDGKEKAVGRVRIESIADNCKVDKPSALTRRGGSIEDFDLAVEEPYGGAYWGISGAASVLPLTPETVGARFGVHATADLAYLGNASEMNDWYLHLDASVAGFGDTEGNGSSGVVAAEGTLGFERRYYLSNSPLYVGLEPRLGFQYFQDNDENEARLIVADALATVGIDFGLSANFSVFAGARGGLVLENQLNYDDSFALQAMAGVSLAFSFGGSSGLFSGGYDAADGCDKQKLKAAMH